VVEHWNQTVVATARTLLKQRGMSAEFWRDAVMTTVHLRNQLPTKILEGKTSCKAWHECTPAVGRLCTFGCLVYVKELNVVSKLSDRSTSGVFIGYAEGIKAYRILDPVTRHVHTTWDVILDEAYGWDWSKETNDTATTLSSKFTVDYAELEGFERAMTLHRHLAHPPLIPRCPHRCPFRPLH
jgi:hypothetical protein